MADLDLVTWRRGEMLDAVGVRVGRRMRRWRRSKRVLSQVWGEVAVKLQAVWRVSGGIVPLHVQQPAFNADGVVDEDDEESSMSEDERAEPPVTAAVVPLSEGQAQEPAQARALRVVARWWLEGRAQEVGRLLCLEQAERERARRGIELWRMALEQEDARAAVDLQRNPGAVATLTGLQGWQRRRKVLTESSYDIEPYVIGRRKCRLAAAELAGVNNVEVRRWRAAMVQWNALAVLVTEQRRMWWRQRTAWLDAEVALQHWRDTKARANAAEAAAANMWETALLTEGAQVRKRRRLRGKQPPR